MKTQISIPVSVYVLVAIVKKRLGLEALLYTLLQILSITLSEKIPVQQAHSQRENVSADHAPANQLNSFTF